MSETGLIEMLNIIRTIKNKQSTKLSQPHPPHRQGSGKSILYHAGRWVGDDIKECLALVKYSRGLAEF
ncbi:hypothetical protein H6G06_02185 [Anabaena sphaerica FACHB-251]|uniref:Uncharacterized protein n=1 Tax=Anabaena sphaerica FACHB-251 TaxID=2692883 RepID=A0A926WFS8_9NOST|nr:hypothetical protein [Anabaena sphaerica]MBD2292318.1 hypothetical protein [Anabaena sphaerica FACHB-251]